MVLQTSGQISLNDIQTEFGGTDPTAITEYFRGGSNVPDTAANSSIPTSGEVSITDFYGGDSTTGGGGGGTLEFNFDYYAYGADINETTVYWYNETTSTLNTIQTITGDIQTADNQSWSAYNIDLSSYSGETGRIVFRYSTGGGYQQDVSLDSMELVGTSSGTIDLDPNTTQSSNTAWEQQGGSSSTYPTSGYSALTTNQEDPADYWQYDTGGTPSGNTGPSVDSDSSASGYYIYFEGSNPNAQTGIYGWLRTASTYTLGSGGGGGGGGGASTGLSASLLQLTGASSSYTQRSVSLSAYAGNTVRLVWRVVVGTTGNVYENDVQIDTIAVTGGTESYNFDSNDESFQTSTDGTATYTSVTFASIGAADTDLYWCRNSGGTPSSNTGGAGAQSGSFYLYTETSSPTSNGDSFWLRSPEITLDSTPGNCTFYEARDITGTTTTLDFYVDVIS